jgi:hypothetical protein
MDDKWRITALVTCTVAAVGVASAFLWKKRDERRKVQPLHVSYKHPSMPFAVSVIASLPDPIRRYVAIKIAKPNPPLDGCDVLGGDDKYDPYEIAELETGKVWRVRYKMLFDPEMLKFFKSPFGVDVTDPSLLENAPTTSIRNILQADMERMTVRMEQLKENKIALLQARYERQQDMLVARLNNGGLLLFNPCRMRPKIKAWLNRLDAGNVQYIVSGSSAHTNQLLQAASIFPDAKIVCSATAEQKCMAVGMRQADYIYSDPTGPRGLASLKEDLSGSGIQIHFVKGDVLCQAACVLVHSHLFEVDLLYGHADGDRFANVTPADWNSSDAQKGSCDLSFGRLFYYAAIYKNASPHGNLPLYRYMPMDPSSTFSKLVVDQPKPDGTSCMEMAASLRELLLLDFKWVDPVHSLLEASMPADEFRRCIDASWRWLDGKALI